MVALPAEVPEPLNVKLPPLIPTLRTVNVGAFEELLTMPAPVKVITSVPMSNV
jgi:hypothetical protein